jgi:rare lipoprotein A
MLAPVPPTPPAAPLAPVGISSTASSTLLAPARTALSVRSAQLNVLEGGRASVTGSLLGPRRVPLARRSIVLQELAGHAWRTVARARTGARGRFTLSYSPQHLGTEPVRVRFAGDPLDLPARRRPGTLSVFRLAGASWYGGGGGLACGGTLTSGTLGVANKTLPCGTLVTLRYGGRTIRVPVIDRGPYVAGREFDLTEATKQALGFGDTGNVWSTR